ncbi:hypothetical protein ATANTOWER_008255 [Ataeniobius toweri]|uniref:Uncharacterized protein n=1 Tax=Ataeniobius toweri TaxID=208326 RepID=A0ABU7A1N0_9TELE|nr:hypothetical protein [Ataeniobius toweri]
MEEKPEVTLFTCLEHYTLFGLKQTIQKYKPQFIALHFQEVGGKDYMVNMDKAESFFCTIESSEEMKEFDRSCIYVDTEFQTEDSFTVGNLLVRGIPVCFHKVELSST